jgi:triosephosphate isomerase
VGGTHTLIGHSERRQYFAETDEIVNKKLHTALKHGVVPVVCVGEVLSEREAGKTADVLKTQITGALAGITAEAAAPIVIAYEPVWAIGTGKTATPEMAVDAHKIIRAEVARLLGPAVAAAVRILYGGSVKPDNATALIGQEEIDGALVGGASLKPDSFAAIVKYCLSLFHRFKFAAAFVWLYLSTKHIISADPPVPSSPPFRPCSVL